tara:strand:- start:50 stop:445 length:396 start_codon:yes stop_codon:yes gene_type:complete
MNTILWYFYIRQRPTLELFGNIESTGLQMYMLTMASLAYIANFIQIASIDSPALNLPVSLALITYFSLQLFFVPLVRSGRKNLVRILLLACCVPMYYLTEVAIVETKHVYLALFTLWHVVVHDFFLYGFMF